MATIEGDPSATHPVYDEILPDWEVVRDAIAGETVVKDRGEDYLPKPSGFTTQADSGAAAYDAYKLRSKFPEIMGPTIRGMVGIIHRTESEIELPEALEGMRESATKDGLPLAALHERITYELLAAGRYGVLPDVLTKEEAVGVAPERAELPYIAGYRAETIRNWSDGQDFFVLDETHLAREDFEWKEREQYRVLLLENGVYNQVLFAEPEGGGDMQAQAPVAPVMRGGGTFQEIPLVIIGSTDVTPEVDEIPLLSVARSCFTLYRLYADYFHQLYMSGQETLFVIGGGENDVEIVGAGVVHNLPPEADAKYVGPSGEGINAHKEAIQDERDAAMIAGARIFDTTKKTAESGEALKMRWSAQTASIATVAINSAKGLERALKYCALFIGANPEEVVVKPNMRFIDSALDPLKAKALTEMWVAGSISGDTLWANLQRGDIADVDRSWEEEQELIAAEIEAAPERSTVPQPPSNESAPPSGASTEEGTLGVPEGEEQ